jgi:hypothetical protein
LVNRANGLNDREAQDVSMGGDLLILFTFKGGAISGPALVSSRMEWDHFIRWDLLLIIPLIAAPTGS